jgi:hypothetical protein
MVDLDQVLKHLEELALFATYHESFSIALTKNPREKEHEH